MMKISLFNNKAEEDMSDLLDEIEIKYNIYEPSIYRELLSRASIDELIELIHNLTLITTYEELNFPMTGGRAFDNYGLKLTLHDASIAIQLHPQFLEEAGKRVSEEIKKAKVYARLLI
jgi:hypothetical protein